MTKRAVCLLCTDGSFCTGLEVDNGVSDDMICTNLNCNMYLPNCFEEYINLNSALLDGFAVVYLLLSSFFWGCPIHSHGFYDHLYSPLLFSNLYFKISLLIETLIQLMIGHFHFEFHRELCPFLTPCQLIQQALVISGHIPTTTMGSKSSSSPTLSGMTCQLLPLNRIMFFCNLFLMILFLSSGMLFHCWVWPLWFPLPGAPPFSHFFS